MLVLERVRHFLFSPYSFGSWVVVGFAIGFGLEVTQAGIWVLLAVGATALALPNIIVLTRLKAPDSVEGLPVPGVLLGWLAGFIVRGIAL